MNLTIRGRPATAKNGMSVVRLKNGRTVSIKKPSLAQWEKDAERQITGKYRKGIDYPVNVKILVWPYRNGRCDLVGYIQAVLDVLVRTGVLLDDSGWGPRIAVGYDGSRIMGISKSNPRIEVEITPLQGT